MGTAELIEAVQHQRNLWTGPGSRAGGVRGLSDVGFRVAGRDQQAQTDRADHLAPLQQGASGAIPAAAPSIFLDLAGGLRYQYGYLRSDLPGSGELAESLPIGRQHFVPAGECAYLYFYPVCIACAAEICGISVWSHG